MRFVPAFVAVAVVSGCVSSEPVVSSYNGSSVSIQTPEFKQAYHHPPMKSLLQQKHAKDP